MSSSARLSRDALGPLFQLGVATSAYQIEGAAGEGGRGLSIWDTFSHTPGKTKGGATGDEACDHYHRVLGDVRLLHWLGVDAYRFSVAWPRVVPMGRGAPNPVGLDFYERLVDHLLEHDIAPCLTLYHWDLPQELERQGGWLARDTALAFADYAGLVSRRLGDRVALWLTHNEPWCQAFLGYETGLFAPGQTDLGAALMAAHHLLLSHGLAVQALRVETHSPIGIAPNFMPAHPASESAADRAAAARQDAYFNRWFLEPVLGQGYPQDLLDWYHARGVRFAPHEQDMATIAQPIDVIGVNYYERCIVANAPGGGTLELEHRQRPGPRTADREIYPEGLFEILERLARQYRVARIVVTENGAATPESETPQAGVVEDAQRTSFLEEHLEQVVRARSIGIPVEGYFAWSLLDNFEWSEGYTLRYGLVHVDFATQKRVPKRSAHFLRSLARRALPESY